MKLVGSVLKNNCVKKEDLRLGLCLTFVLVHSRKFHVMASLVLLLDVFKDLTVLGEQELLI